MSKNHECDFHKPLDIDCDRFTYIWNALESMKHSFKDIAEPSEVELIDIMQKELEAGIVEK